MPYTKYTKAQGRATAKWQAKMASIGIRVTPDTAARYKAAAKAAGLSLRAFVMTAVEEKIARENLENK